MNLLRKYYDKESTGGGIPDEVNPALLINSLRWNADMLVYLHEYSARYWLTDYLNAYGKKIGITSCCEYNLECEHHNEVRNKLENQNKENN